jgi:hypothetical protein
MLPSRTAEMSGVEHVAVNELLLLMEFVTGLNTQ